MDRNNKKFFDDMKVDRDKRYTRNSKNNSIRDKKISDLKRNMIISLVIGGIALGGVSIKNLTNDKINSSASINTIIPEDFYESENERVTEFHSNFLKYQQIKDDKDSKNEIQELEKYFSQNINLGARICLKSAKNKIFNSMEQSEKENFYIDEYEDIVVRHFVDEGRDGFIINSPKNEDFVEIKSKELRNALIGVVDLQYLTNIYNKSNEEITERICKAYTSLLKLNDKDLDYNEGELKTEKTER